MVISPARAQDRLACESPSARELAEGSLLELYGVGDPDVIELLAGEFEAVMGERPAASMSGGVVLRRGNRLAGAETATFDSVQRALKLTGGVRYEDPDSLILSDSAEFGYDSGLIRFEGAEFEVGPDNARGEASVLEISQDGRLRLVDVGYTTCPPESNDWIIEASEIELDTRTGVGKARGVRLRFQGVPILYTPYLSFPITNARKSGVLTPEIGSTGRSGNELSIPYYWNIAENYDATLTPRLLTERGLQFGTEFRYLLENSDGILEVEYLPDDTKFDENRHQIRFEHQTLFASGWRNQIDFRDVSDNQYFEDLGGSLSAASITHLNRSLAFDFFGENWSLFARVQEFQTIDSAILPDDEPYRRLPQIYARGYWPDNVLGLTYSLDTELVYFDRDVGVTGWRLNAAPQVALPIEKPGWFVIPAAAVDHTRYDLQNTSVGQDKQPSRTVPIVSLDTGLKFERLMKFEEQRVQTLEPRLLYVHVPHREQSGLPVFDTITPDLNLVQLYRKNRFLGVDRIADMDQLSIGVTSRIIDVNTGRELMSATIGQALYLSEQNVTLPGESPIVSDSSDYIAEIRFLVYENLNFDVGYQWGGEGGTAQSEARLQYRPQSNKILNFAYRFRRQSLEQGDVSWSWPLSQSWNFVGRYNYSFRDDRVLEQFYGVEFESCCWGLRLVSREYISTRDGTRDSSFGLQLVLKGMTNVGTKADRLLERGILGYSPTL
ncbi:MAG: LPS assembly protein LptD [Proteobacteria bacterium]|nr:LPS assembly protein LptD [Pseudomonadota bacterium]